jgi:serine/threonine-protein kinase RsbW
VKRLSLFADLPHLATIRDFVVQVGCDLGLDKQTIADLELAVDEACANIVKHAYRGQGGQIEVLIEPLAGRVRITIRDWGQAFDPQAIARPDVTAPLDERPLGGLGLFLIHQVMDDVQFHFDATNGNTLTMVKRTHRRELC